MLVLVVVVEKGVGIDVPGVNVVSNWRTQILAALGLGTTRTGINGGDQVADWIAFALIVALPRRALPPRR